MTTATSVQTRRPVGRATAAKLMAHPSLGVIVLLVATGLIAIVALPSFVSGQNLTNLVGASVVVAILAMGMTVVLIAGGIDLSIGAVMGLCAAVAATLMSSGLPMPVAFLAALLAGAAAGVFNGLLVTRVGLPDFIATLATLGFATGIVYIWTQGTPIIAYMTPEYYVVGGLTGFLGPFTVPMIVALLMALILAGVLGWTRLGTHLFAVGSNRSAAGHTAVPVVRIQILAYVISGLCAAVAGIIMAGRNTTVPADLGNGYNVQAIAAAMIGGASLAGGRGGILGAVLGALTLGAAINIVYLVGVPPAYQTIVTGLILLVAVLANRITAAVNQVASRRAARQAANDSSV